MTDSHNKNWHRKNHKRKVSSAKRSKDRVGKALQHKNTMSIAQAEQGYKDAIIREQRKELTRGRILYLRFISIRGIVIIRKVAYKFSKLWQIILKKLK